MKCFSILLTSLCATLVAGQEPRHVDRRVASALESWRSDDPKERLRALQRLKRIGPEAAPAIAELIAGLKDTDRVVKVETAWTLRSMGPAASPAIPALLAALDDPDIRTVAAWTIRDAKPDARTVLPVLLDRLRGPRDRRSPEIVPVLGAFGEAAVPTLIDLLKDEDARVRTGAVAALQQIGPEARAAVPALMKGLHSPDPKYREKVAAALAAVGRQDVETIARAVRDREANVRGGAAMALEKLGRGAAPAVPALIAALAVPEPPMAPVPPPGLGHESWTREGEPRPLACQAALAAIGPAAVPALMARLDDADHASRVQAMRSLGFLRRAAKPAIPRLVTLLDDPGARDEAAATLGGMGSMARGAIPRLIAGLKDADPAFRTRAAETLGRIGWSRQDIHHGFRTMARGAIRPLRDALKDSDARVRTAAARALEDIGEESSAVLDELLAAMNDPVSEVRLAVVRAFRRIDGDETRTRDALIARLKDPDERVRAAAESLKPNEFQIRREPHDEAEPVASPWLAGHPMGPVDLRAALGDPDPVVRAWAAEYLPAFRGRSEVDASIPLLTARLKDADPAVRLTAAEALGRFGPEAKGAVSAILDLMTDADDAVSVGALRALPAIGPEATAKMNRRLADCLDNRAGNLHGRAVRALEILGEADSESLFRMIAGPDTPRTVRILALDSLSEACKRNSLDEITGAARESIPALEMLARDEDPDVREKAHRVLVVTDRGGGRSARSLLEDVRTGLASGSETYAAILDLEPRAIPALVEGLKDPDEAVRIAAATALKELAEKLPRPEDRIEAGESDPSVRDARARELQLRTLAAEALAATLKDDDTQVPWVAAVALGTLGASGSKAIPALVEMAQDRKTRVHSGVLVVGGTSDGAALRAAGLWALGSYGQAASPAVPVLIQAMDDDDPLTRWAAVASLGSIGPPASSAVPGLIGVLRSRKGAPPIAPIVPPSASSFLVERLDVQAAIALGRIGPAARAAVSPLTTALNDQESHVRVKAAEALGEIGPDAAPAIPALIQALDDPMTREQASAALKGIGTTAIPALREAARSPDQELRIAAIHALGQVGPAACEAIPDLRKALADADEEVRTVAVEALGNIAAGPRRAAVIPALLAATGDLDRFVRKEAATALGKVAPNEAIIPPLIALMKDRDGEVRHAAAEGLTTLGTPAVPPLLALLRDERSDVRSSAESILPDMIIPNLRGEVPEPEARARERTKLVRDALLAAMKDTDERIRAGASRAFGRAGNSVVPELTSALEDPSALSRRHAALALRMIGGKARPALEPLAARLADPDPGVRAAADAAIRAILRDGS